MSGPGAFGCAEPSAVGVTREHESRLDPWTVAQEANLFDAAASVLSSELFGGDSCVLHRAWIDDQLPRGSRTQHVGIRNRLRRGLHRGLAGALSTRLGDDALLGGAKTNDGRCCDREREHDGQGGLASFVG